MSLKIKIFILLFLFIASLLIIKFAIIDNLNSQKNASRLNQDQQTKPSQTDNSKPQIVSTTPDPLDETIIPSAQILEITFNKSLENVGEFKLRIEPEIEYKVELSPDRKTAKIIPAKPFALGATYTLFIGPETKFDGVGRWGEEKIYHFRTIKYTGV